MGRKLIDAEYKGFDHYAIHVLDVEESTAFYRDIVGFKQLPRPDFDFKGAWFDIGNGHELHLIEEKELAIISGSRRLHFAFTITNVEVLVACCEEHHIEYLPPKLRPDGVTQVFVKDNSGWWLEFNKK